MNENIMERIVEMLKIPEENGEDVNIGSFYYDMAAMYALEGDELKKYGINITKNIFVSSCDEETLIKIGEQMGLPQILNTYAKGKVKILGAEGMTLPKGVEISSSKNKITYLVTETNILTAGPKEISIEAKKMGSQENVGVKELDTCSFKDVTVEQDKIIMNGTDLESFTNYRKRLLENMRRPRRSGNKNQIKELAEEFLGIGRARCIANRDEKGGTLKLLALDNDLRPISESKRQGLHEYIKNKISDFAELTTEIPVDKKIDLEVEGVLHGDYTAELLKLELKNITDKYFREISFSKSDNVVSIMNMITIINSSKGLKYFKSIKIDSDFKDITLNENEIPVLKDITIKEV